MIQKSIVKIPKTIRLIFSLDNKILIVFKGKNILMNKLDTVFICKSNKKIYINSSNKSTIKKISDIFFSLKSFISNSKYFFYKKLVLKGVGYRFILKCEERSLLQVVLGFSHSVFVKLPKEIKIFLLKPNILFLTCTNYLKLNSVIQLIQNLKSPDSYKGKGINLEYHKINLKEGKKAQ